MTESVTFDDAEIITIEEGSKEENMFQEIP
jgi:hypothetical protein